MQEIDSQTKLPDRQINKLDLCSEHVLAAYSGRDFDAHHRNDFFSALQISSDQVAKIKQTHGNIVKRISLPSDLKDAPEADGLITNLPGIALSILTADCIPAFVVDPKQKAIALVHAGWKGLKSEILPIALHQMIRDFHSSPQDFKIAFGPSIRICCYEVGPEFQSYFPDDFAKKHDTEQGMLDLVTIAKKQCLNVGVLESNIFDSKICTACSHDKLFSARRDKTAERIISVMMLHSK